MIQLGLFDPLPLGPWVKPTVADLLARTWEPAPWPKGYACIYKATLGGTTKSYVGKTVDLRERFRNHTGGDDYIDRALNAYGPENFSIEVLWVAFSCDDAYAHEGSFIEAHRTRRMHGGYNIGAGGSGFTSEEARDCGAVGGEVRARRAGHPQKRVLAELEKGPRTVASMAASLGFTKEKVQAASGNLRLNGHHIIGEWGGLWRLVTLEEAADDWASGPALSNQGRVLGLLMKGPRTVAELAEALGVSRALAYSGINKLRERHNIENRRGGYTGTYHLIIDHKRHPWLHLGTMAWNDPTFSLQYRKD